MTPIKKKNFNLYKNYFNSSEDIVNIEPEGISIDGNGNVFLGLVVRKCLMRDKNNNCTSQNRLNTIFTIGNKF